MATNLVHLAGDQSNLILRCTNLSGSEMEIASGSFRPSPDERRIASVFLQIDSGAKELELRLEFTDPRFVQVSVTGRPILRSPEI